MSVLIKGGTIVTAEDIYQADIYVEEELINAIGTDLPINAEKVINAEGLYVMPGGVDPHCHIQMELAGSAVTVDDYETGSIAAACGGTTSIIDIAFQKQGESLQDAVTTWHNKAAGNAVIDYSFHAGITDPTDSTLGEMEKMVADGICSFKVFLANPGTVMIEDDDLLRIFQKAKNLGGLVVLHAENGRATEELAKQSVKSGKGRPEHIGETRPPETEVEAVDRAINLADMTGTPIHFYHISTALSVDRIRRARANGSVVFAETCPHYLFLTEELLAGSSADRAKYVVYPPLRTKADQNKLWDALTKGDLQVVSSDHCAYRFAGQKDSSPNDFRDIPGGLPGVETRLPLVYSGGVADGRLELNRFVQIVATNPAKIFGLYPQKGTIAVGSDADLVLWNPRTQWEIKSEKLHMPVDYTPFEGINVSGKPYLVMSRGKEVVRNGEFVGQVGSGRFIKRSGVKL